MQTLLQGVEWQTDEPLVLLEQTGSFAHGTRIPPEGDGIDDIDAMGVVLPDRRYVIGLTEWGSRGTKEVKRPPLDIILYDLRKFVGLLLNGNPNVLGMLFPPKDCLVYVGRVGQVLLDNRRLFLGKHIHASFAGYASAQLKKMYATEGAFAGYMGDKRKQLVLKHGFDTKNAGHLIRLLEMGIELLDTHVLNVRRENAEYLKQIKRGEVSLAEIRTKAENLFGEARKALERSTLPDQPCREGVETLLVEILGNHCAVNASPYFRRGELSK